MTPGGRYERKFMLHELTLAQLLSVVRLHPALFAPLHAPRWINNLYLDGPEFDSLHDNLDGVAERTKVRVRWYGALFGAVERPRLEVKVKRGLVGWKESFSLAPFVLDERFGREALGQVVERSPELSAALRARLRACSATLVNRYHRRYFRSADGRFRITVDSEQRFHAVRPNGTPSVGRVARSDELVLELKYAMEHDDEARRITNHFPFRLTKSSKYVRGVLATRG